MLGLSFTLTLPTSTNRLHAGSGAGMRRRAEYERWLTAAGWEINEQRPRQPLRRLADGRWWRSRIRIPFEDVADVDNRVKALHDLLVSMRVVPDDRLLHGFNCGRSVQCPPGKCLVRVWSI